jgi:hypothetical protein
MASACWESAISLDPGEHVRIPSAAVWPPATRHANIEQGDIGLLSVSDLDSLGRVFDGPNELEGRLAADQLRKGLTKVHVVFSDQHPQVVLRSQEVVTTLARSARRSVL